MNTIEKEIYQAIQDSKGSVVNLKSELDITFKCASIVEKYTVGFSDWQRELVFTENSNWLKEKTTKELYDLYLETL